MSTLSFLKGNVAALFSFCNELSDTITVIKKSNPTYDPTTGGQTVTSSSSTVKGLLLRFRNSEVDGTLILKEDQRLLIPYSSLVIDTSDTITISGASYRIINARGDITNSYWDLQIRKL